MYGSSIRGISLPQKEGDRKVSLIFFHSGDKSSCYILTMDVLQEAIKYGIISLEDVEAKIEMNKKQRKEKLENHPYAIWEGSNGKWYTYEATEDGRRLIKRSTKEDIEDYICGEEPVKVWRPNTFDDAYWSWRKIHDKGLSGNSITRYETDYLRFLKDSELAKMKLSLITRSDIQSFIFCQIREKKLCQSAAKKLYEYIHGTFIYCLEKEWIDKDPMQFMHTRDFSNRCYISERSKKEQTIARSDSDKILEQIAKDHAQNPNYIPSYAVEFAMLTAMRVGEIAGLRWKDVENDSIKIVCSEKFDRKTNKYYIDDTKNRSERRIPMTDSMRKVLFMVRRWTKDSEFVFGGTHANVISSCIRNKCRQAKVDYHGIHACRKTINSNMRSSGAGTKVACDILGNTEEVNAKYYSFDVLSLDEKRNILEKAAMITR